MSTIKAQACGNGVSALQPSVEKIFKDGPGQFRAVQGSALRKVKLVAAEKLQRSDRKALAAAVVGLPLWQLDIVELTGHNIEARGREEVNELLGQGWRLLHIYTLKYQEEGVWRERPMAILGRLRK